MKSIIWLLPVIGERRGAFIATLASNLMGQLAILAVTVGGAFVLGRAMFGEGIDGSARAVAIVVGALALAIGGLIWWEMLISHDLAYALLAILRSRAFGALARALPDRRRRRGSADDQSTAMADVETLEWLFAHTVAQLLTSAIVLVVGGTCSALISPALVIVWLVGAVSLVLVPIAMSRWGFAHGARVREARSALTSGLVETVQGASDLIAAGALAHRIRETERADRVFARAQRASSSRAGAEDALGEVVLTAVAVIAVVVMGVSSHDGSVAPALVPVAMTLAMGSLAPAAQIAALLKQAGALVASARRVQELFTADPAAPVPADPRPIGIGGLELDDVTFGYDPGQPVLHGVSLRVEPGETVALVGASGAGKSTCAALVARFWDPDAGEVRVGGTALRDAADDDLRAAIAVVPQETHLLRGTLEENLRLARPDVMDAAVHRAAQDAGLLDEGAGLPEGLDTVVGERGEGLSGGQRARVAIARALLRDPRVLVLDEAVAHLDSESERRIARTVVSGSERRATLVIAHRPSTIDACDRAIVLEDGRVVEEGDPAALRENAASRLSALLRREPGRALI